MRRAQPEVRDSWPGVRPFPPGPWRNAPAANRMPPKPSRFRGLQLFDAVRLRSSSLPLHVSSAARRARRTRMLALRQGDVNSKTLRAPIWFGASCKFCARAGLQRSHLRPTVPAALISVPCSLQRVSTMVVQVPVVIPQGLKPLIFLHLSARLKPCPCYKTDC